MKCKGCRKPSWPGVLSHNFPEDQKQPQRIYNSNCSNQDLNKAPSKCNTTTPNYLVLQHLRTISDRGYFEIKLGGGSNIPLNYTCVLYHIQKIKQCIRQFNTCMQKPRELQNMKASVQCY